MTGPELSSAVWRKSSYSTGGGSGGDDCVEVAKAGRTIAARDSKNPAPTLLFTATEWAAFLTAIKMGRFVRD